MHVLFFYYMVYNRGVCNFVFLIEVLNYVREL
nr:MAG TPA: hypothetical protein [Caudoviricetes sp.]